MIYDDRKIGIDQVSFLVYDVHAHKMTMSEAKSEQRTNLYKLFLMTTPKGV